MFLSARSERNQWPRPPSLAPLGQFTLRIAGTGSCYEGRFPGVIPRSRRGWCSGLLPLPRRCRWLGNGGKPSGWTRNARLVPAAVGASAFLCQTKQHGISQADPVGAAGSNLRHARAQWPERRGGCHSGFARRKELPAEGASPKTAFWFLCRRGQRNPPPGRRNPLFRVLSRDGKNQRSPGVGSGECKHSSRPPPDPRYGRRFPEVFPRIRRGWCSRLPPLPRRCRWLGNQQKTVRLDQECAPGASSRRSWAVVAGGWGHPPLPPIRQTFRRGRCLIGPPGLGPAPERHFAFLS